MRLHRSQTTRALLGFSLIVPLIALAPAALASPAATPPVVTRARMETMVLRLKPDDEVLAVLDAFCQAEAIDAGCILSAVGSFSQASLRFANQSDARTLPGPWEVVSFSGRLTRKGSHLHASVSDKSGHTLGGHVMPGTRIFTTMELVIGVMPDVTYQRQPDGSIIYQRR